MIPVHELERLAQTPPEERGRRVRVVQGFSGAEQPPEAPPVGGSAAIYVAPGPVPVPGPRVPVRQTAKSMAEESKWWLVLAGVTAVGLAVTEGLRYDGWVELDPRHPVHLWGPGGQWTWVPLADLDLQTARWARKGFVRAGEGPWHPVGRAPLDRVGLNYSLLFGTGEVPAFDGAMRAGFLSHIQFGVFPVQQVGLVFDIGLGWRTDRDYSDIFHSRYTAEIQVLPLAAGVFHAGGYGQVGLGYSFEDFPDGAAYDRTRMILGAGGIAQLELTTRMALTVRAGATRQAGDWAGELTAGISIY